MRPTYSWVLNTRVILIVGGGGKLFQKLINRGLISCWVGVLDSRFTMH